MGGWERLERSFRKEDRAWPLRMGTERASKLREAMPREEQVRRGQGKRGHRPDGETWGHAASPFPQTETGSTHSFTQRTLICSFRKH